MNFNLYFDIIHSGYSAWMSIIILSAFVLGSLSILLIGIKIKLKLLKFISIVFLIISIPILVFTLSRNVGEYFQLVSILEENKFEIIEGYVKNFIPKEKSNRKRESFIIDGIKFIYSDHDITSAFKQSKIQGGPIYEGAYVKIHYYDGKILRLWVAE